MSIAKEREALAGVEGMASSASVVHLMGPAPAQSEATVKLLEGASLAVEMNRLAVAYPGSKADMAASMYQSRAMQFGSSPVVASQPIPFVPSKEQEQPMPAHIALVLAIVGILCCPVTAIAAIVLIIMCGLGASDPPDERNVKCMRLALWLLAFTWFSSILMMLAEFLIFVRVFPPLWRGY